MEHFFTCLSCEIFNYSCFNSIKDEDVKLLAKSKVETLYKKGQNIFYTDRKPTGIYCLNSGSIKIFKVGENGKEQIVRFVTPGSLLGIRAFMGGRKYAATATAMEDSFVCFIEKKTFFRLILKYPNISQCLMTILSQLLEEAEDKLTSIAQKPVRERLAETLILLEKIFVSPASLENNTSLISISREDLANIVGTATETVIRKLKSFKEENLIELSGRKIKLIDKPGILKASRSMR